MKTTSVFFICYTILILSIESSFSNELVDLIQSKIKKQIEGYAKDLKELEENINFEKPVINTDEFIKSVEERLVTQFDGYLKDPKKFRERIEVECGLFPEGDLFSLIYPAMAYVNLAMKDKKNHDQYLEQAKKLLREAKVVVEDQVYFSDRLEEIDEYQGQGVYLGQFNLALGSYCLVSEDKEFLGLHNKISEVLNHAMGNSFGRPIDSYPFQSWPFDTIPVIVSLRMNDVKNSQNKYDKTIQKHQRWIKEKGTDVDLELPYSWIGKNGNVKPRGCDLSFRLCLLPHLNSADAKKLYQKYIKNYWIENDFLAGFAEWPTGSVGFQDIDSGPIFMGIGLAATGIGTVKANGDSNRLKRLCEELYIFDLNRKYLVSFVQSIGISLVGLNMSDEYFTGFLFGDAMLFYCITWTEYDLPSMNISK